MGEYYDWINIDKKEYLNPISFDYGSKFRESTSKSNKLLGALQTLLANEWKDDHIIWLGDETEIVKDSANIAINMLYNQTIGYGKRIFSPAFIEDYKDVSVYFKEAQKETQEELDYIIANYYDDRVIDYYKIDINDPYKGLYEKTIKWYRYMINHTKKIYYDVKNIMVIEQDIMNKDLENDYINPLPLLMGYGRYHGIGEWLGDIVGVSDEIPEGYELIDRIYFG